MTLNQPTINTLEALYSSMDKDELDEALDLLLEEALKREWEEVKQRGGKDETISNYIQ